jgi:hypothetical protein
MRPSYLCRVACGALGAGLCDVGNGPDGRGSFPTIFGICCRAASDRPRVARLDRRVAADSVPLSMALRTSDRSSSGNTRTFECSLMATSAGRSLWDRLCGLSASPCWCWSSALKLQLDSRPFSTYPGNSEGVGTQSPWFNATAVLLMDD